MDGDAAPELWATPTTAVLLREAAFDPALVTGVRAARALWRPLALVHADLKHDNVLVEPGIDGIRVRVLDWEMARVGDPAWDLAALTARLIIARGDSPPWSEPDVEATVLLVGRYAQASGLRVPGLANRLVLYTGVLLLMMALQHGSTLPPHADNDSARRLVMRARATFARAERLTEAIASRAIAPAA
jgi:aminoglycoside phosphotransferase (APT) family kinase protein